jgi:hypothetical protein
MVGLGMVLVMAGYSVGSWGYCLVKGYNITLREWVSPLHPFTGPLDSKGCVPKGHIFPVSGQGGPCGSTDSGANPTVSNSPQERKLSDITQREHRPIPGSVAGRY